MLIFMNPWREPSALSFPSKHHGRFYLERTGKWWLQHAVWHKKETKLHIIMFNMTFQWAISSFWNSGMVYFFSPGLEVLPRYPFIPVLRMTEMKWAAGKGVTATRRFIWMAEKRLKAQLSSLSRSLSTFLLLPVQRLMSVCMSYCVSEWGFLSLGIVYSASCFQHLRSLLSVRHAGAETHTVFFIIILTAQRCIDCCLSQ